MRPCAVCKTSFSSTSPSNVCCSRACSRELNGDFVSRFWGRVDRNGPIAPGMKTPCWLWTGRLEKNGYARVKRQDSRTQVSVHRAAWEMKHGEVPPGMLVLHRCDVRNCVRHLFLGTQSDNMLDMRKKGRAVQVRGEQHGRSKLTEGQVRSLLSRYREGATQMSLAVRYKLHLMTIHKICTGKRWAHLQG
jgi:hypothetical protein